MTKRETAAFKILVDSGFFEKDGMSLLNREAKLQLKKLKPGQELDLLDQMAVAEDMSIDEKTGELTRAYDAWFDASATLGQTMRKMGYTDNAKLFAKTWKVNDALISDLVAKEHDIA
jgi:hypothetical protein